MEGYRSGVAWTGEGGLGAVPRRLRQVLHQAPGRSRQTKGDVGRELRQERSLVCEGRGACGLDVLGGRRGRTPPCASGVEDDWRRQKEPIRGDLAALSRRLRQILRA